MKFHDFVNFGIVLKPKNKIKYARMYKSVKDEEKELIGCD
jgi:hypothetical protein